MGAKTDYLENLSINHMFRSATWAKPTAIYVALFTSMPGETGGGTEVTGGSYARVLSIPDDANWSDTVGGNGTTSNLSAITFPAPTADWGAGGQVVGWGIYDAPTGGALLIYAALTTAKSINNGDPAPSFGAGALTYQDDN